MKVEQLAREVTAALDTDAGYVLAAQWIDSRYRQLCSRARLRHLRKVGEVVIPAAITTGAVACVRGTTRVYGDADAVEAWLGAGDLEGWSVRLRSAWYEVSSLGSNYLELAVAYAEADLGDIEGFGLVPFGDGDEGFGGGVVESGGYVLVRRYVPLALDARWLGTFVHARLRREVHPVSHAELDIAVGERLEVHSAGPRVFAEVGTNAAGARLVEFYPYCRSAEHVRYVYWSIPPRLGLFDEIPAQIDPYVLKEGALIDLYRYESARAARSGAIDVAALMRNEMRAQATAWERNILEAIGTDRGSDDVSFVLEARFADSRAGRDISTARDEVWARGARP